MLDVESLMPMSGIFPLLPPLSNGFWNWYLQLLLLSLHHFHKESQTILMPLDNQHGSKTRTSWQYFFHCQIKNLFSWFQLAINTPTEINTWDTSKAEENNIGVAKWSWGKAADKQARRSSLKGWGMCKGEEAERNRFGYKQAKLLVKIRNEKQPQLGYCRDTYADKINVRVHRGIKYPRNCMVICSKNTR